MRIPIEIKKAEAIGRMKTLGIRTEFIKLFEQENCPSISMPPYGILSRPNADELQHVREYENSRNVMVYFVIRSYMDEGKMDNYLYVSDFINDWALERKSLKSGEPLCYAYNYDIPPYSDTGRILIERAPAGGFCRID